MGKNGGERGIRTLDGLLTHTPLAGERFRPLSQLSILYSKEVSALQLIFGLSAVSLMYRKYPLLLPK